MGRRRKTYQTRKERQLQARYNDRNYQEQSWAMIKEIPRKKNPRPQRKRFEEPGKQRKRNTVQLAVEMLIKTLETSSEMNVKVKEKSSLPRYD